MSIKKEVSKEIQGAITQVKEQKKINHKSINEINNKNNDKKYSGFIEKYSFDEINKLAFLSGWVLKSPYKDLEENTVTFLYEKDDTDDSNRKSFTINGNIIFFKRTDIEHVGEDAYGFLASFKISSLKKCNDIFDNISGAVFQNEYLLDKVTVFQLINNKNHISSIKSFVVDGSSIDNNSHWQRIFNNNDSNTSKYEMDIYTINKGLLGKFDYSDILNGLIRLKNLNFYSEHEYVRLNQDVERSKIDPTSHAFCFGFSEGRTILDKKRVARSLGLATQNVKFNKLENYSYKDKFISVGVFYNSEGNIFLKEIADSIADSINSTGNSAFVLDEKTDINNRPEISIFVGPHEFFQLGEGRKWISSEVISNSIMYNTEQPQTVWFERGLLYILMSKGVIDISYQVHSLFESSGIKSFHFNSNIKSKKEWLYEDDFNHPLVKVLPCLSQTENLFERPIDICFFGNTSRSRERFFSRNAKFFSEYDCYLYYRRFDTPLTNRGRDGLLGRLAGHLSTQSKITLNIHRDDIGFFEWHRIVQIGMAGGGLVVSEPCPPHPIYKPSIHYFEETGRHIPNLIDWLLKSKDGKIKAMECVMAVDNLIKDAAAINNNYSLVNFISSTYEI